MEEQTAYAGKKDGELAVCVDGVVNPHAVHYSAERIDWETPSDVFDALNEEFNFELDVCALPENAKCGRYFTPEQDGLRQKWAGVCWMNPPYGNPEYPCKKNCKKKKCVKRGHCIDEYIPGIVDWMRKAHESSLEGATIVCLVPARTDTNWWHDYAMKGKIRYIRGRIQFVGATENAPFPNAIVVFGG